MWQSSTQEENAGRVCKITVSESDGLMSVARFVELMISSADFRSFFNDLLANAKFDAFFWEMPPLTRATFELPFECIVANSSALAGVASDADAFAQYFADDELVVAFPNLGGDAFLVAPCSVADDQHYAHLATFVRDAPETQRDAFWRRVGEVVIDRISDKPLWVSTSGLGIYWLHVRLDTYPKYYTYLPYRVAG